MRPAAGQVLAQMILAHRPHFLTHPRICGPVLCVDPLEARARTQQRQGLRVPNEAAAHLRRSLVF